MKRKVLQKNILKNWQKGSGRSKVIAVVGVHAGVGVTHSVLLIANYLRRQKLKIAIIELNGSRHLERIERAYEGMGFDSMATESFRIKQVTYYKNIQKNQLIELYKLNYDVIILDIGQRLNDHAEDYQMADVPIIIGQTVDWKREELNEFLIKWQQWIGERTKWLMPFATEGEVKEFSRNNDQKAYGLDFVHDPFVKSKVIDQQLEKLFR